MSAVQKLENTLLEGIENGTIKIKGKAVKELIANLSELKCEEKLRQKDEELKKKDEELKKKDQKIQKLDELNDDLLEIIAEDENKTLGKKPKRDMKELNKTAHKHADKLLHDDDEDYDDTKNALKAWKKVDATDENLLETWKLIQKPQNVDVKHSFDDYSKFALFHLKNLLYNRWNKYGNIKFNYNIIIKFKKVIPKEDGTIYITKPFKTDAFILTGRNSTKMNALFRVLDDQIEQFQENGSDWVVEEIAQFTVDIAQYKPLKGRGYVELPDELKNAKAIINVKNGVDDNRCFMWSILSKMYPAKDHVDRLSKYNNQDWIDLLGFEDSDFPVKVGDIPRHAKRLAININVFSYHKKKGFDRLLISDDPYNDPYDILLYEGHYCWIKDINKLMATQNKHKERKFLCKKCLKCCSSEGSFNKHWEMCRESDGCCVELPSKGSYLSWLTHSGLSKKKIQCPYAIYADFEALTCPYVDDKEVENNTERYQQHVPCSYGIYATSIVENEKFEPIIYRGRNIFDNIGDKFVKSLYNMRDRIMKKVMKNVPIEITPEEEEEWRKDDTCHICEQKITIEDSANDNHKVRDHCHLTGKYRGPAHNCCNLNFKYWRPAKKDVENSRDKLTYQIPVILHNMRGYDAHFIIQAIARNKIHTLNVLPLNKEKYITFSYNDFKFIDSFSFMASSLEKLVCNLKSGGLKEFKHCKKFYTDEQLELFTQKGVYPYDYMNHYDKFKEKKLPDMKEFYSKLYDSSIDEKDYEHAINVWNTFKCKNIGDYHDIYLKSDILLLADVFEAFRRTCMETYSLDPCHYLTAPGLAWDAMLKMTGVKLELLSDMNMVLFVEKGIRGGVSVITKRYAKANNQYLKNYDPTKEKSFIKYLDANNLYGWSMLQKLPYKGFKWCTKKEIDELSKNIMNLDDQKTGWFFEVDMLYPKSLHDLHNDFPFAPESVSVSDDVFDEFSISNYNREMQEKHSFKTSTDKRLIPNLNHKHKYIIHYKNLQQCISHGLILTKVHRVIKFEHKKWMKKYIMLNQQKRIEAKNEFEKDFYKLMNNSVFGKTMENVRKRTGGGVFKGLDKIKNAIKNVRYNGSPIYYSKDCCWIDMIQKKVTLDKPIYVGFAILDLSKWLMYDLHYNVIKKRYGNKATLLFQDTDSLCYEIKTDDVYQDMHEDKEFYDLSNYSSDHPIYDPSNFMIIGKLKDEAKGREIIEFCGHRSKMYSLLIEHPNKIETKNTAKGIKKCVKDCELKHERYVEVLMNNSIITDTKQNTIRSYNHQLFSISQTKTSLSCIDLKRYISDDGIHSYAYGHYKINEDKIQRAQNDLVNYCTQLSGEYDSAIKLINKLK